MKHEFEYTVLENKMIQISCSCGQWKEVITKEELNKNDVAHYHHEWEHHVNTSL